MSKLQKHQIELIEGAMSVGALKFGSFVLKSGRQSPYFINAGPLCTGPLISAVASGYAALIAQETATSGLAFDVLFGPAYKGIPFAAATALVLHEKHGIDVEYAFDRKEVKDHGEGGKMVGADVKGKRVLILDDVMTAGTAVRQSIDLIRKEGGTVVGVVMLLDREEVTVDGRSTVKDIEEIIGGGAKVRPILLMRDLMTWLEENGQTEIVEKMKTYYDQYGVKG